MARELDGKTAIVTGAGQGIGRGIALCLGRAGARVVVDYLIDARMAESSVSEIEEAGGTAIAIQADVTKAHHVGRLVTETVAAFETVDILVNNAGTGISKPFEDFTAAEWDLLIDVDLKSVFLCSQIAGAVMRRQGSGVIINIASVAAKLALPYRAVYSSVKAGVIMFTAALAAEWASHNIRVNCIAPGTILTPLAEKNIASGTLAPDEVLDRTPLRRFGEPEEIGQAAVFLASDAASYITGQTLSVDGGWSIWGGWTPRE
jgi:NAD(P)-dependent dehydrogenase (short-subunit alcohol dehydrogenase family)